MAALADSRQADWGNDLVLKIAGTTDCIQIDNGVNDWASRIETVRFADGTSWSSADLLARATAATGNDDVFYGSENAEILTGGAGADFLAGRNGNDVLLGGAGNDTLRGGGGDDTFRFALGDGQDLIQDNTSDGYGGNDTIEFGPGILASDVTVSQVDWGNYLMLKIAGTADRIQIDNGVNDWSSRIETIRFADGTSWNYDQLLARVGQGAQGSQALSALSLSAEGASPADSVAADAPMVEKQTNSLLAVDGVYRGVRGWKRELWHGAEVDARMLHRTLSDKSGSNHWNARHNMPSVLTREIPSADIAAAAARLVEAGAKAWAVSPVGFAEAFRDLRDWRQLESATVLGTERFQRSSDL
ncbi:calcium-binding protein [Sphingomonas sp. DT-204]|uniref:calcium-binding protein n=1 Tax=Sphingomonas sp. DT-204 TaxID=3396166 RepID=UPI003F1B317B